MDAETKPVMKILVLSKRQYTGKDLLDDRFGRLRELPLGLAQLGHEVKGLCLSYRPRSEEMLTDFDETAAGRVTWQSLNLGRFLIPGLVHYLFRAKTLVQQFQPDLIWACSDAFHAILGAAIAKHFSTKCVVDLYDNFEAFGATRTPGVLSLFKRAVRNADGVTYVSKSLSNYVSQNYCPIGPTMVLENAVRKELFYPRDMYSCRRQLGLPEGVTMIGTAGSLFENRGIKTLFDGFKILTESENNLHLVIAGPRDRSSQIPKGPQVHDLGILPLERIPLLINALNVAVIYNRDSKFGRYCFPQKAHEILACRTPVVAADVGTMQDLLRGHSELLFEPDNPRSCAEAIQSQLCKPTPLDIDVPSWPSFAEHLAKFFATIISGEPTASPTRILEASESGTPVR